MALHCVHVQSRGVAAQYVGHIGESKRFENQDITVQVLKGWVTGRRFHKLWETLICFLLKKGKSCSCNNSPPPPRAHVAAGAGAAQPRRLRVRAAEARLLVTVAVAHAPRARPVPGPAVRRACRAHRVRDHRRRAPNVATRGRLVRTIINTHDCLPLKF